MNLSETEFGVRWQEWNRKDQLVTKERIFKTEKALDKFVKGLEEKDNFHGFVAWLDPLRRLG
ncbi:MAG TPA: hypothetical protein PKJ51_07365 [Methanothrix sp.]|nr:hypothetical protein [Methanothrix sp.]